MTTLDALRATFRSLHDGPLFVMPNAWDQGSARLLEHLGFAAIATTSSGHAATLGRSDGGVTLDELAHHVAALHDAVAIPINVDAERCFADDEAGVAATIDQLAAAGAAGVSIEDWNPATATLDTREVAVARVTAAAAACRRHGVVLTGRAENHIRGVQDLQDTIDRLCAYREAGADVLYAPGLVDAGEIARVVDAVGAPLNVLTVPGAPDMTTLGSLGVRRVSVGGAFAWVAYGAMVDAARELREEGTTTWLSRTLPGTLRRGAFRGG